MERKISDAKLRRLIRDEILLSRELKNEGVVSSTLKTLFNGVFNASMQSKSTAPTKPTSKKPQEGEKTTIDDSALIEQVDTALVNVGDIGQAVCGTSYKSVTSQGDKAIVDGFERIVEGMTSDVEKSLAGIMSKWGKECQSAGLSAGASVTAIVSGILFAVSGESMK